MKSVSPSRIRILGGLSLAVFLLYRLIPCPVSSAGGILVRASEIMSHAEEVLRTCRERKGIVLDPDSDINRTGLIGIEASPITTTLGRLESKRTVTNPNTAAVIVRLLTAAGVRKGETIAVGASGSFPGLIVAVLAASRALELRPLLICSLGASEWGANDPRFTWPEMSRCLAGTISLPGSMIACTIGGENDVGSDLGEEGRACLREAAERNGCPFFEESDLRRNVERRMRLYEEAAGGKAIAAFVNIGGAWANIGTDASILRIAPGLVRMKALPPPERRGILQEMYGRGIPVIHLLNIAGLSAAGGLPWDPSPLPKPGEGDLYERASPGKRLAAAAAGCFIVFAAVILLRPLRPGRRRRRKAGNT
jgi:poly-gamma-glutamate system protein